MKNIVTVLLLSLYMVSAKAQEIIKVGDERTIACTGTFIGEAQHYYSDGKPGSLGKYFADTVKDSLVIFAAYIDGGSSHTVYRYAVAKKDVDTGDWGLEVAAVKENGVAFQLLKITSADSKNVITEEKYRNDDVEVNDPTNQVFIYFPADKQSEARKWADKIKQLIQ